MCTLNGVYVRMHLCLREILSGARMSGPLIFCLLEIPFESASCLFHEPESV